MPNQMKTIAQHQTIRCDMISSAGSACSGLRYSGRTPQMANAQIAAVSPFRLARAAAVGSLEAVVGLAMGHALLHAARPPCLHSRTRLAEIPQRGWRWSGAKSRHGIQPRHGPTAARVGHHADDGGNFLQRPWT